MKPTTQVFIEVVQQIPYAAPMASGMCFDMKEQALTVQTVCAGDLFVSIGKLDGKKFQAGDKVKVIIQRIGRRRDSSHASS